MRFCVPQVMKVPRDIDSRGLQKEILHGIGSCLKEGINLQVIN